MAIMIRLSRAERDTVISLFDALDAIRGARQLAGPFYLSPEENDPNAEVLLDKAIAETALAAQEALVEERLAALGIELEDIEDSEVEASPALAPDQQQQEQQP